MTTFCRAFVLLCLMACATLPPPRYAPKRVRSTRDIHRLMYAMDGHMEYLRAILSENGPRVSQLEHFRYAGEIFENAAIALQRYFNSAYASEFLQYARKTAEIAQRLRRVKRVNEARRYAEDIHRNCVACHERFR